MTDFRSKVTPIGAPAALISKTARQGDEIEHLETVFKEMAGRIEQQIQALRKSDTLRRELVAHVSHDLRTPLANLQGYMETLLIKDDEMAPAERCRYLQIAIKHCERLSKLVSDLFELARLDSQTAKVDAEAFNLAELLQDVIQKFELTAQEKGVRLQADFSTELPFVQADIGMIERVLENLIENALRHTPQGGEVHLVLAPAQDDIVVQVRDTGAGIDPERLPRIFERFYQIEDRDEHKTGQAGLGLAITKRILELHGQTITVESVVDGGTCFTFQLPASAPA